MNKKSRKKIITFYVVLLITAVVLTLIALAGSVQNQEPTVLIRRVDSTPMSRPEPNARKTHRMDGDERMRLKASMGKTFSDKQDRQLSVAQQKGIMPISDLRSAYRARLPISEVVTNEAFTVDTLKHSLPYLQTDALQVLSKIGTLFSDSVERRTGRRSRIIVTSLLRTDVSIAKLRRRNRNAVENSTHRYGRTFDISYRNFAMPDSGEVLNAEMQKNILAGVLYKLRNESLVYVKYERKQGCFHITVR